MKKRVVILFPGSAHRPIGVKKKKGGIFSSSAENV